MTSKLGQKRIKREIEIYSKDNFKFPNLILRPCEEDILKWYFIVYDLKDTPYDGGVYFGKVVLPKEYPLKPPDFYFITPNGRFEVMTKICTTFSSFHQDTYTSTWNIMTMMEGMISFMTDTKSQEGIGYIETSDNTKITLAKNSLNWNKSNEEFNCIFYDIDEVLL